MRYILLFSDGTISVGATDEVSRYLVWGRRGWRAAVSDLAFKVLAADEGKISNLEIQSHGEPARIITSSPQDDIDYRTVADFGTSLRPLLAPGALIEIMACYVATCVAARTTSDPTSVSPAAWDEYWNGLQNSPVAMMPDFNGRYSVQPLTGDELAKHLQVIATNRTKNFSPEANGLEFCLTLAKTSGAIVRAARLMQKEEYSDFQGKQTHSIMRDFDRFGDWEGPVFDFLPSGNVKFLGCNLPRHRLRFPTQQVGPQLTYNFREQGGNDAGVGQRPQRRDRSPLPV